MCKKIDNKFENDKASYAKFLKTISNLVDFEYFQIFIRKYLTNHQNIKIDEYKSFLINILKHRTFSQNKLDNGLMSVLLSKLKETISEMDFYNYLFDTINNYNFFIKTIIDSGDFLIV